MANLGSALKLTPPKKPLRPLERADTKPELFATLLEAKWRDVPFPISSARLSFEHTLVEHEYYGRDVANVENTGRKSRRFDLTIPFFNGQAAGKSESWGGTPPFPTLYFRWLKAFDDRTHGYLQHPIHGTVRCKAHTRSEDLDADRRSGVLVTASWVEDFEDDDVAAIKAKSPAFDGVRAAADLDASLDDLRDKVPLPSYDETFEDALNKLTGFIDSTVIRAQLLAHKPAQILSRIGQVQRSLERLRNAAHWPAIEACERLRESVIGIAQRISATEKPIKRYTTRTLMTLAMVANTLQKSADEIVKLNPQFLRSLEVPAGSVIRYYA